MIETQNLTEKLKEQAQALGFDLVGIAAAAPSAHASFYREWLAAERHGEMSYLARTDAVQRRLAAPAGLRSAIVVGLNYYPASVDDDAPDLGVIARYARGRDYHKVIKAKLFALLDWLETEVGHELPAARACVDTAPVLERELAQRAGLGWFGRNTMLIHPRRGSYFFLGVLLVELELEPDKAFAEEHCGTCNACVSACPTGALLGRAENGAPMIDARRCISYLTIEQRGPIPAELRPLMGNRVFGCDICQEVCPWNSPKFVSITAEPDFSARTNKEQQKLLDLIAMDEKQWDEFSRGSAIRRAKRAGFLRNIAVALGNWGSEQAVPALTVALDDAEPLVRGHAAWALGRINSAAARHALSARAEIETDDFVRAELEKALTKA
jgi:epoxyqueuosine reductase